MRHSIIVLSILLLAGAAHSRETIWLRETFENLERWSPLLFPKIKEHSTYTIRTEGPKHMLVAFSQASASAIRLTDSFDVGRFPVLAWQWKVDSIYQQADPSTKEGDDYPLRMYVMFPYDPANAGFATRARYRLARALYGEYPPLAALNYVWASSGEQGKAYPSPYTNQSIMVPLQTGPGRVGEWIDEEVHIVDDYRRLFNKEPPRFASLAIMNDSDNTGGSSTSYVSYIEIRKPLDNP